MLIILAKTNLCSKPFRIYLDFHTKLKLNELRATKKQEGKRM